MFDVLAQAMRLYPTVRLSALPRMADFCKRGYAVAEALGGQGAAFLAAYLEAISAQTSAAIEHHPVATAVIAFLGGRDAVEQQPDDAELWAGTATDLLTALEQVATDQKIDLKAWSWPKAANALMRRLNEVRSNLLDLGIQVTSEPDGTQRQVTFPKVAENIVNTMENQGVATDDMPDDSAPPLTGIVNSPEETLTICDDTDAIGTVPDDTAAHLSSEAKTPSHNGLEEFSRASDDTDDIFGTLAGGASRSAQRM